MTTKKLGIWGFGRFGELLSSLLIDKFDLYYYDTVSKNSDKAQLISLDKLLLLETVILAIPINQLERALKQLPKTIKTKTFIDVCSVKTYPCMLMEHYLPPSCELIATHPMFGPDSYFTDNKNKMMMHALRIQQSAFREWVDLFSGKNIAVTLMSPEEHDQQCAYSQNITHLIGRILHELNLKSSSISTLGYNSLLKIIEQTCNDSKTLFYDLNVYNPYSENMILQLNKATEKITQEISVKKQERINEQ